MEAREATNFPESVRIANKCIKADGLINCTLQDIFYAEEYKKVVFPPQVFQSCNNGGIRVD